MSYKDRRNRRYFINLIPGNEDHKDQMRINGRVFDLCDIRSQKRFLKVILDHFCQNCEFCGENFEEHLREAIIDVRNDYQKTRTRYGQVLG